MSMSMEDIARERYEDSRLRELGLQRRVNPQVDEGNEPPACMWCGRDVLDPDDGLEHGDCWNQRTTEDDLRDALDSCAKDIMEKLHEYRTEITHWDAPAHDGPELERRAERAIADLVRSPGDVLTQVVQQLCRLRDDEQRRSEDTGLHTVTPRLHHLKTAINALCQINREG